jgi:hypothetical protein
MRAGSPAVYPSSTVQISRVAIRQHHWLMVARRRTFYAEH